MHGTFDGIFPVLGETPASPQPCKDSFDDPTARQDMEALGGIGAPDDLDGPVAHSGQIVAMTA